MYNKYIEKRGNMRGKKLESGGDLPRVGKKSAEERRVIREYNKSRPKKETYRGKIDKIKVKWV
jgi:hypothetical protein